MARPNEGPKVRWKRGIARVRMTYEGRAVERSLGRVTEDEALRLALAFDPTKLAAPIARDGEVYFVEAIGVHAVKIGWSSDIAGRMEAVGVGPHDLRFLGSATGTFADERRVHRLFDDVHIRGEWFFPSKSLRAFVERIANGEPLERVVSDAAQKLPLSSRWVGP